MGHQKDATVMLVEDSWGYVFGAFVSSPWSDLTNGSNWFGNGETFVFTFEPSFQSFRWTSKNDHFVLLEERGIGLGSTPDFAFWLDANFENGTSSVCQTFDNKKLASSRNF